MTWNNDRLRVFLCGLAITHLVFIVHCQEDNDENLDLDEERHMREHELDFHDLDDYEMHDQGYNVDEDYDIIPEGRHTNRVDVGDAAVYEKNDDVDKVETIDYLGTLNPELIRNMKFKIPDFREKSNVDLDRLKSEIKRLGKIEKSYRESVSSLLATTADLRIQIMQLNTTVKRLDERDRQKDEKIKDLERVIASQCGYESKSCTSEKNNQVKESVKRQDEL